MYFDWLCAAIAICAGAPRTDHLVEICGGRCLKNGLYSRLPAYLQTQQTVAHSQACVLQIHKCKLTNTHHTTANTQIQTTSSTFVNAPLDNH